MVQSIALLIPFLGFAAALAPAKDAACRLRPRVPAVLAASPPPPAPITNDWSQPCLGGECSYDYHGRTENPEQGKSEQQATTGSVKVWSEQPNAISDITPAAGWVIMDCDPRALNQSIRIVCANEGDAGCDHLYIGNHTVGKLIRLPESCGQGPFARVARSWLATDQTVDVPQTITWNTSAPVVHALQIDTDFAAIDVTVHGNVFIAVTGTNVPNANVSTNSVTTTTDTGLGRRGWFDWVTKAIEAIAKATKVNLDVKHNLPTLNVDETYNLFSDTVDCPDSEINAGLSASIHVNAEVLVFAATAIGVAASGTIIPPKIDDFVLYAGLSANIDTTIDLKASASGTLDTGSLTLYEVGIPGLNFPGILSVAPSFKIKTRAVAELDIAVGLKLNMAYKIDNMVMYYPPSEEHPNTGSFLPSDENPLRLSVAPSVESTGRVEAHLIPTIDFGITALGGLAEAVIFLNVDASAHADFSLKAGANATVEAGDLGTSNNRLAAPKLESVTEKESTEKEVAPAAAVSSAVTLSTPVARRAFSSRPGLQTKRVLITERRALDTRKGVDSRAVTTGANGYVNGCVAIGAGLSVNVGARGNLFNLWKDEIVYPLYAGSWDLYSACFGITSSTKNLVRSLGAPVTPRLLGTSLEARALSCSSGGISGAILDLITLIDGLVKGKSIA